MLFFGKLIVKKEERLLIEPEKEELRSRKPMRRGVCVTEGVSVLRLELWSQV